MATSSDREERTDGRHGNRSELVRQRMRIPKACLACLKNKRACSQTKPSCTRCLLKRQECIYSNAPLAKPRSSGSKKGINRTNPGQIDVQTLVVSPSRTNTSINMGDDDPIMPLPVEQSTALQSLTANSSRQDIHPPWSNRDRGASMEDDALQHSCQSVQSAVSGMLHPSSEVLFRDPDTEGSSIPAFRQHIMDLLPLPKEAALFIADFRRFLRPALPALLDPDFVAIAEEFLLNADKNGRDKISLSWLAVMLMMLAIGQEVAIERQNDVHDGMNNGEWLVATPLADARPKTDALLNAAHRALRLVSFHSSPTLQTVYCQLLMGLYLLQTERVAVYWPIHGSIVRQAQAIGLHIEPKRALPDQQFRRQLWWAIVQQDVLLSSIFRLPLAVSNFSCQTSDSSGNVGSCFKAQAEFTILERRNLMHNMNQEWNREELKRFKADLLSWYDSKPDSFRVSIDDLSRIDVNELRAKLRGKTTAAIESMVDHLIQLQYTVLMLYRDRLQDEDVVLQEESYMICGNVIHNIVASLSVMVDLLGTLQAGNVWLRLFYTFHAGVTAAYLAVTRSGSELGKQAESDLIQLTSICQRLPQRYKGLQTINDTFSTLLKQIEVKKTLHQKAIDLHQGGPNYSNNTHSYPNGYPTVSESGTTSNSTVDMDMHYNAGVSLAHLSNDDLFANVKFGDADASWTGNFQGPFGPTDLLPGPQASGEEILSFWNQYFSTPGETDALQFG